MHKINKNNNALKENICTNIELKVASYKEHKKNWQQKCTLPCIAASLLTPEEVILNNILTLKTLAVLEVLKSLGASVKKRSKLLEN